MNPLTNIKGQAPLKLHISLERIAHGGYKISYSGSAPIGQRLWLGLPDTTNAMDVTGKPAHSLLDSSNLPKFLSLIGAKRWWGNPAGKLRECRLFIGQGLQSSAISGPATVSCPVQPLACHHRADAPTLGLNPDELRSLKYAAENKHGAFGRSIHIPAIDGCYYFRDGHRTHATFETNNEMRGLVCTTYVSAVWGMATKQNCHIPSSWNGTQIASESGAPFYCKSVGIKEQPLASVKDFLNNHKNATYLVGSSGHVVLVVRGRVHQFTNHGHKGYQCTSITNWHTPHRTWTVGQPFLQF